MSNNENERGFPTPNDRTHTMSTPQHQDTPSAHLKAAIDHAARLANSRPATITPGWSAQAAHVGDMSVLLLALRA